MHTNLSRRHVLMAGATTTALSALPSAAAFAASTRRLTAATRTIEVNGKAATMFAIMGSDGQHGAVLAPGERFAVNLNNSCGEPTIIHWHGQTPPVAQDGVALTGFEKLIANGAEQGYDFTPRPGTHWMHSHHGLQEQRLMAAPLVVRTVADAKLDAQDVTVMLHDFTFRDPNEILSGLRGKIGGNMSGTGTSSGSTTSGSMSGMAMSSGGPDLNDVDFDAYLANDRTLGDPEIVRTEANGRVRLRLINGATSTAFWIDLGELQGQVIAVDGDPVHPVAVRRFPMAEAQRVDVLLRLPTAGGAFPILAQREGDRQLTGIILASPKAAVRKISDLTMINAKPVDLSLEARLSALFPLAPRQPDRVHRVRLTGNMASYVWGIDEHEWPNYRPLSAVTDERVAFDIVNETAMAHPMHLHGHHFQVVALNGISVAGAIRDTVLVPARGSVRIVFDASNPGRWLFHCHNLYHMAAGMMTELRYI
ncbi:multicopper oxidase family protein [Acidocella aminolytica]|nr:multicopper oxidase domain-containing protein [Acidocella aminolytica]